MKRLVPIVLGMLCLGLAAAPTTRAADASCLLRVTFDSDRLPLSYEAMDAMVSSSGVAGVAMAGVAPVMDYSRSEQTPLAELVSVSFAPAGLRGEGARGLLFGRLTVSVEDYVPDAHESAQRIMATMCARLRSILEETGQQDQERLRAQVTLAGEEFEQARQRRSEIRQLQQSLCAEAGMMQISRELIVANARNLENEQRHIEMNLAAQRARREAIAQRIGEISQKVEHAAKQDPVVAEMEKAIMLREKEVGMAMSRLEQGVVSANEAREAQERMAQMQVELAHYRREAIQMAGGNELQALNQELAEMLMETSALEASLAQTAAQAERYNRPGLIELVNRYEDDVELQLRISGDSVEQAARWQQRVEQELRGYQPPALTILGGAGD